MVVGNSYTKDDIERAMNIYRGTGCYDEITYQIKECDSLHWDSRLSEAYDLSINMKPAQPHVFGLGIRYDTEEGAASICLSTIGMSISDQKAFIISTSTCIISK